MIPPRQALVTVNDFANESSRGTEPFMDTAIAHGNFRIPRKGASQTQN